MVEPPEPCYAKRYMPRARRVTPSPRPSRSLPARGASSATPSLDEAFQAIVQGAVQESFAPLMTAMRRLSERLSGQPYSAPPVPARKKAPAPPPEPEIQAVVEQPVACAVIGCRQPVRTLGYCSAHYQKRRQMVATGRLHAAWVEHAAPHSIPDVILSRRRRSESSAETPASTATPAPSGPRVWVRKKGQTQSVGPQGEEGPSAPSILPTLRPAEGADAADTVKRWAAEFLATKRRN
ncbi:cell wall protein [Myxococcus qinghaiensis]|uniref:cell wall protein n=1 Tax=Myxococcus qinghaiensis TaxID=2906758 RepID=UPI0020A6F9B6|nr:cell wall protein [Myxococcus qinghaiensis]